MLIRRRIVCKHTEVTVTDHIQLLVLGLRGECHMGNCCGKDASSGAQNNLSKNKTQRVKNWEATGVVSLRDARLKDFPPALEGISHSVRVIDATNNKIERMPGYFGTLGALQRLVLSQNALTVLPPEIGALQNLKVLLLDSNQLASLPTELGHLSRLERLSLAGNCLSELPATLGLLCTLRQLDCSINKLRVLPGELGGCAALEELNAGDNYLQAIPAGLSSLQQLKTLQLDGNRIQAIPPGILSGCTSLQTLSLHNNPITMQAVEEAEGYSAFEQRRKAKFDKSIGAGVLLDSKGLDEGVDRRG